MVVFGIHPVIEMFMERHGVNKDDVEWVSDSEDLPELEQDSTCVVAYLGAADFIGGQLTAEANSTEILASWKTYTEALLEKQRKNRRGYKLLNMSLAQFDQVQFESLLAEYEIKPPLVWQSPVVFESSGSGAMLLQTSEELTELAERLFATSLPFQVLTEQVANAVTTLLKSQQKNDANDENELLLLQLQQVQEELEAYFIRSKEFEKQSNYLEIAIKEKNEKLHTMSHKLKAVRAELEQAQKESLFAQQALAAAQQPKVAKQAPSLTRKIVGKLKKKSPSTVALKLEEDTALLEASHLFDAHWYVAEYPDVAESSLSPVKHYLKFGGFEGRNPSVYFDSEFYLNTYPDVKVQKQNPLVHFLTFGEAEGRLPLPERD